MTKYLIYLNFEITANFSSNLQPKIKTITQRKKSQLPIHVHVFFNDVIKKQQSCWRPANPSGF